MPRVAPCMCPPFVSPTHVPCYLPPAPSQFDLSSSPVPDYHSTIHRDDCGSALELCTDGSFLLRARRLSEHAGIAPSCSLFPVAARLAGDFAQRVSGFISKIFRQAVEGVA